MGSCERTSWNWSVKKVGGEAEVKFRREIKIKVGRAFLFSSINA